MDLRFRYKSGYRKNREQLQVGRIKPIWPNTADMCIHPYYWNREFAIKQGDVKLKNESQSSWEKYILDFLFYISIHEEYQMNDRLRDHPKSGYSVIKKFCEPLCPGVLVAKETRNELLKRIVRENVMSENRHIILTPDWRAYFWYYLAGLILTPLFGVGLIFLWLTHKKRTSHRYEIHDDLIRWHNQGGSVKIDLLDINNISVNQGFTDKKFGVGTVTLAATVSQIKLFGMENPHELAGMIREAIHAEEKRQSDLGRQKPREPEYNPGTLEKMNYLTGLWQQGLISDEDYEKEKKHFE